MSFTSAASGCSQAEYQFLLAAPNAAWQTVEAWSTNPDWSWDTTGLATGSYSVQVQAQAVLSQSSYYSHDDLRAHFGLGAAARAERLEVRWPSGAVAGSSRPCPSS